MKRFKLVKFWFYTEINSLENKIKMEILSKNGNIVQKLKFWRSLV